MRFEEIALPEGSSDLAAPDASDEVLYQSARTRVVRRRLRDGSVIRKEALGAAGSQRLRREVGMLRRLVGVAGVPELVDRGLVDGAIVMRDEGAESLAQRAGGMPMAPTSVVALGRAMAEVISAIHHRGVIHGDINPANIVVAGDPTRPTVIDYDLATTSAEERPGFSHETEVAGTLTYLAPERTGRTGWPVDQRADLYELGATLYELATGTPPFGYGEPLPLIHAHLTTTPLSPTLRNPDVPASLSAIIMRLLAKEPARRYQSAEGVVHDLARLGEALAAGRDGRFPLGELDFSLRFTSASRPVGREQEIAALTAAFAEAQRGASVGVLVTGPPGVGKTTLIDELRPVVAASGGWLLAGKFDELRRDREADAVWQALGALGRLLLAQPDAALAADRHEIRQRLGPNAGLLASVLPEISVLLGVDPDPAGGSDGAQARLVRAGVDLLRAVAGPERPLVMTVDDLQWAVPTTIGVVDTVFTERPESLLLIGAYRPEAVDAVHPLMSRLGRWERLGVVPTMIRLANLPPTDLQEMLADLLRMPHQDVWSLAEAVAERTEGNPLDTIELVNALRQEGTLALSAEGWRWDTEAVRRHLGQGDARELIAGRVARLPERSQELLRVMSCLGGQLEPATVAAASGLPLEVVEDRLEPALADGLLVPDSGARPVLRFRHDRVREAVLATLGPGAGATLRRGIARNLATHPDLRTTAAEQYLPVADMLQDPAEQGLAADLFRGAATAARLTSPALAERFLRAARPLLAANRTAPGSGQALAEVEREHYLVLCGLGRFDEADQLFELIEARVPEPVHLLAVVGARIASLRARNRQQEALAYGLDQLRRLGLAAPSRERLFETIEEGVDRLTRWAAATRPADDLTRPEVQDPAVLAASATINQIAPVAFFEGDPMFAWLVTEAQRLWVSHGPSPALVGALSQAAFMSINVRDDYRTGYDSVRRVLAVSEARGWEPYTSLSRYLYALSAGLWFQPLVDCAEQARETLETFRYHGDPNIAMIFYGIVPPLVDCAEHVDTFVAEVDNALAVAARVGDEHSAAANLGYRQLGRALRGQTNAPGSLSDDSVDMRAHLESLAAMPPAAAHAHASAAVAAAIFDDQPALSAHTEAVLPLLPFGKGTYVTVISQFMRALALIEQARQQPPEQRAEPLAALADCRDWLASRAEDAPHNYGYMVSLIDAERHWLDGDLWQAAMGFDSTIREVSRRQRTGHRALISERASRFYFAQNLEHVGRSLLAQAARRYADWGASGKVAALERAHPFLRGADERQAGSYGSTASVRFSSQTIDLLAVLDAARVLSSATGLDRLREQLGEVLSVMTGATSIHLLTWDGDAQQWRLPQLEEPGGEPTPRQDESAEAVAPMSVVRYVQRTLEPLLVEDAVEDGRFGDDPHLSTMECCSLLAVPILSRGALKAVLLLTKPGTRGAFTDDRLDAVLLIAGQLAVSLENAAVYASLEQKVDQRTRALAAANERLEHLNQTDPLTGLANRRCLEEELSSEWTRGQSLRAPVTVAMLDIDHFKLYNDRYGHPAGDECLRRVAAVLKDNARSGDIVARYGGEEFALVLPGATVEAATQIAERVRLAVASMMEPNEQTPVGFVTVSIGVAAAVPAEGGTSDQLIEAADAALYEAKRAGRNRIVARAGHGSAPQAPAGRLSSG